MNRIHIQRVHCTSADVIYLNIRMTTDYTSILMSTKCVVCTRTTARFSRAQRNLDESHLCVVSWCFDKMIYKFAKFVSSTKARDGRRVSFMTLLFTFSLTCDCSIKSYVSEIWIWLRLPLICRINRLIKYCLHWLFMFYVIILQTASPQDNECR